MLKSRPVHRIRYRNIQLLIEAAGGLKHGGLTRVAEKINKTQGQTSHFAGAKPIKNIGDEIARQVEAAFGYPEGWMDRPHDTLDDVDPKSATVIQLPSQPAGYRDEIIDDAMKLARFWLDLQGSPPGVEDHVPLLKTCIQVVLGENGPASLTDLSKKLAARLREESNDGDQRRTAPGAGDAVALADGGHGKRAPKRKR